MHSFFQGFLICAGLIVAIGPQNAFVLRQGLKHEHIFLTCVTALLSDMTLVLIGAAGLTSLVQFLPKAREILTFGGVIFLIFYSVSSFRSSLTSRSFEKMEAQVSPTTRKHVVFSVLAFSFLNPHAILDTIVLIGGAAAQKVIFLERLAFTGGAVVASASWFFLLGYGSMRLRPLFSKPKTWKVLDFSIGIVMAVMAIQLGQSLISI